MDDTDNISVYVMGKEDVHVGLTGRDEAPIALIIPKAHLGIGLPVEIAQAVHDAICNALALLESEVEDLESEFADIPKNKLN
jgi:hypothetical protein